jgi:hypothetical protein
VKLVYIRLNYTAGENITETIHQISEKKKKEENNPKKHETSFISASMQ